MSLPAALAAPRVSQSNSPTSLAEPAFYHSALRWELAREFGEKVILATGPILPFDHYRGDATGCKPSVPGCARRWPNRSVSVAAARLPSILAGRTGQMCPSSRTS